MWCKVGLFYFFFFKQKTAYEIRPRDWSSDVCSSDLVIGIPCSSYPDSWFTPANGNAVSYLRAIEAAGGIPALIHLTRDAEVLDAHYGRCDPLLFAGGEDVHPSFYSAEAHPKLGKPNPF